MGWLVPKLLKPFVQQATVFGELGPQARTDSVQPPLAVFVSLCLGTTSSVTTRMVIVLAATDISSLPTTATPSSVRVLSPFDNFGNPLVDFTSLFLGWQGKKGIHALLQVDHYLFASAGDELLPLFLRLDWHSVRRTAIRTCCTAGSNSASSSLIIAKTTNNSTSVKPRLREGFTILRPRMNRLKKTQRQLTKSRVERS